MSMSCFTGDVEAMIERLEDGPGFQCIACKKVVMTKGNLKKHIISMHFGEDPQDCHICGKQLRNLNSLQNHISIQHRGVGRNPMNDLL